MDLNDTLISYGGELKSLGETATGHKIGGYLVVFNSPDASPYRDRFTKSTDFDIENGERTSIYYNHGLDGTIKRTKLGSGTLEIKDDGVWFEGEIKKRSDYLAAHIERIASGMTKTINVKGMDLPLFGLSSGVPAHLVERVKDGDGHEIKSWPLRTDASITPTPAEPLTACVSLKSLVEAEAKATMSTGEGYAPEVKPEEKKCPDCGADMDGKHCSKCDYEMKYSPDQPRDDDGRWGSGGSGGSSHGVDVSFGNTAEYANAKTPPEDLPKRGVDHSAVAKAHGLPEDFYDENIPNHVNAEISEKYLTPEYNKAWERVGKARTKEQQANARAAKDKAFADLIEKAKAVNKDTKSLTDLNESLHAGLSFDDHSVKVLAAIAEYKARCESLAETRCGDGRRWSAEKYEQLNSHAEAVKALAEVHRPRRSEPEVKTASPAEVQALAEYQTILAQMNGVELIPA